jgi:hypothetical protein
MAARARPPWWRVIDWRVVVAIGLPVWYAAGMLVIVGDIRASSRAASRPGSSQPVPRSPLRAITESESPRGRSDATAGPVAWFALTAAVDPRIVFGIGPNPPLGPFAARLVDGGGPTDAGDLSGEVWRRAQGRVAWTGPPAAIDGFKTYGTFVPWRSSPAVAMDQAATAGKLALVVHVSGPAGEDEWFAETRPCAFRNRVLASRGVGQTLSARYVAAIQKVVPFRSMSGPKPLGAVASYFCTPAGQVLHAVPGDIAADQFLREADWAASLPAIGPGGEPAVRQAIRSVHFDRLKQHYGLTVPYDSLPRLDRPGPPAYQVLDLPVIAALPEIGKVHALLAVDPLPRLDHFYPIVWDRVLADRTPVPAISRGE